MATMTMNRITYTEEERTRIKAMSRLDNQIAALPMRSRRLLSRFYKARTLLEAEEIQDELGPVEYPKRGATQGELHDGRATETQLDTCERTDMSERIQEIAAEICQNGVASAIEKYGEWINNKTDPWAIDLHIGLLLGDKRTGRILLNTCDVSASQERYSIDKMRTECARGMEETIRRGIANIFLAVPRREAI